jgi:AAA family ATP:ADP antiporter
VLSWLGVRGTLFIMPLVVFGSWTTFAAVAALGTIRITKTFENSVDYSVHKMVGQALYLPTSRESKYKAKVAIDTFFFRAGDVIAGGAVFVAVGMLGLGPHVLAGVNVVLSVIWLWLAWRTGRLHDKRAEERRARAALGIRETAP